MFICKSPVAECIVSLPLKLFQKCCEKIVSAQILIEYSITITEPRALPNSSFQKFNGFGDIALPLELDETAVNQDVSVAGVDLHSAVVIGVGLFIILLIA